MISYHYWFAHETSCLQLAVIDRIIHIFIYNALNVNVTAAHIQCTKIISSRTKQHMKEGWVSAGKKPVSARHEVYTGLNRLKLGLLSL